MNKKEEKARECVVIKNGDAYEVESTSGNTYRVTLFDDGASATCTCTWGQVHGVSSCEHGCSHMIAVWLYEQGNNEWEQEEFLREQDQTIFDAGQAYQDAMDAGYSDADAAAAADSIVGFFGDEI